MYNFIDQPRDRLVAGSRFLLDAMRGWASSAGQNRCPLLALAPCFSRVAMREVLEDFHSVLLVIHRESHCRLTLASLGEDRIGGSEAVLLALWADIVTENLPRARAVLELVLPEPSIEPCIARMGRVAAHMSACGLAPVGLTALSRSEASGRRGKG